MVLVMTIIALIAAITFPTASSALDSLRLRTAGERVVSLLNSAMDRADRVQQVVEIRVSPEDNAISARSVDLSLNHTLAIPAPVRISSTGASLPNGEQENAQRRYLLYPGGAPPHIQIELETAEGRKRLIRVDPVTGMLHSDVETAK